MNGVVCLVILIYIWMSYSLFRLRLRTAGPGSGEGMVRGQEGRNLFTCHVGRAWILVFSRGKARRSAQQEGRKKQRKMRNPLSSTT